MQTLKDDIRQRIIATARAEFIAHGVRCTSIRTVARKSGVAVGNQMCIRDSSYALY